MRSQQGEICYIDGDGNGLISVGYLFEDEYSGTILKVEKDLR